MLTRLVTEPTVQFLAFGALLFLFFGEGEAVPSAEGEPERVVVLETEDIARLSAQHTARAGRPPNEAELDRLIAEFAREEALFREAHLLGLDEGDPIVRRRLIQSMTFLSEDLVPVARPTDQELADHLSAHPDRYRRPERVSLEHVFVARDRHGSRSDEVAAGILTQLLAGIARDGLGDPFLRGASFRRQTRDELAAVFGARFADAVFQGPGDQWFGPVESSYGLHSVRITARDPASQPPLDAVREAVEADWLVEAREHANEAAIDQLVGRYRIEVRE